MTEQQKPEVLVSPEGDREWTPEDATQATNLRARGWTPKANKSAPKTTTK
jgi:hypothetical protein